jgi:biopolymer transport protein ExbD
MAEIQIKAIKNKSRIKYLSKKRLSVDLTPMVDLGFLLITFFILTTSLATPSVTKLLMPKDDKLSTTVCESCALTLLPQGSNEIYYYEGIGASNTIINKTTYAKEAGLRSLIQNKKKQVFLLKGASDETVIIIKPGKDASYKNIIDILDEIKINGITHYFVASEDNIDKKLLRAY